ncbi:MAG TPA: hypothetical protein VHX36_13020 [Candidatus Acidoferrales bacterium]|nr:hypothetical protein [Candidatus Acidoferrales bacterium]
MKGELEFLEAGGYRERAKTSWRPQFIFEDSPTCLYSEVALRRRLCSACALIELVPANRRREQAPCRHIPLNGDGETLDSLYRMATEGEIEAIVAKWLKTEIEKLEQTERLVSLGS